MSLRKLASVFFSCAGLAAAARTEIEVPEPLSVLQYLDIITKDESGNPNPRVSCTAGNEYARRYIQEALAKMGLKPLGHNGTFVFTVPKSQIPGCDHGLANVIGYVEGTERPDEFLLWDAHYDGPNNEGLDSAAGIRDTTNVYDDGSAVALGLHMAATFAKAPPKSSIIFLFSDGEEGYSNIGIKTGSQSLPDTGMAMCESQGGHTGHCHNFPIGATAFVDNPTVELSRVKLALFGDPLGTPGIKGSDFVAVLGSESARGLRQLLEKSMPQGAADPKALYVHRRSAGTVYSDGDAFAKVSVPYAWLAQTGFQTEHGGHSYLTNVQGIIKLLQYLGSLMKPTQDLDLTHELAFWGFDTSCGIDPEALQKVSGTILGLIRNLADGEGLNTVFVSEASAPPWWNLQFRVQDASDAVTNLDHFVSALTKGPSITGISEEVSTKFIMACRFAIKMLSDGHCGNLSDASPTELLPAKPFCQDNGEMPSFMTLVTGIAIAMDFYSSRVPAHGTVHDWDVRLPPKCKRVLVDEAHGVADGSSHAADEVQVDEAEGVADS